MVLSAAIAVAARLGIHGVYRQPPRCLHSRGAFALTASGSRTGVALDPPLLEWWTNGVRMARLAAMASLRRCRGLLQRSRTSDCWVSGLLSNVRTSHSLLAKCPLRVGDQSMATGLGTTKPAPWSCLLQTLSRRPGSHGCKNHVRGAGTDVAHSLCRSRMGDDQCSHHRRARRKRLKGRKPT